MTDQCVAGHPTPRGQIRRRTGVQRDYLENHARHSSQALAQFEDKLAAPKLARVPLGVVIHAATQQRVALRTLVASLR